MASNPADPVAPLPTRATGADLVLAGRPAGRSTNVPGAVDHAAVDMVDANLSPTTCGCSPRVSRSRSVGLVLPAVGQRGRVPAGVLEELEAPGSPTALPAPAWAQSALAASGWMLPGWMRKSTSTSCAELPCRARG